MIGWRHPGLTIQLAAASWTGYERGHERASRQNFKRVQGRLPENGSSQGHKLALQSYMCRIRSTAVQKQVSSGLRGSGLRIASLCNQTYTFERMLKVDGAVTFCRFGIVPASPAINDPSPPLSCPFISIDGAFSSHTVGYDLFINSQLASHT